MAIETNEDVARRVRGLAAERKVKRTAIADALHLSRMAVWRRMEGETPFTPEEMIRLSRVMDVPVAAFYTETPVDDLDRSAELERVA
jgi:transcriptional regulator with XRE-family HTH domain